MGSGVSPLQRRADAHYCWCCFVIFSQEQIVEKTTRPELKSGFDPIQVLTGFCSDTEVAASILTISKILLSHCIGKQGEQGVEKKKNHNIGKKNSLFDRHSEEQILMDSLGVT